MKKSLWLAAILAACFAAPAHAQQATTVSSCGGITWDTAGVSRPLTQNLIGQLCTPPGTTTTVTGNVTVVQPTGTNLHTVLDTTSTTAVTQATGTNLHAVLDATSTTAVTQATAGNLNATVVGTGTFVVQPSPYPSGATPITCASGDVANTNAVCTLAGVSAKTTYITGFRCGGMGSTAALVVGLTVAGVITGTQTHVFSFPGTVTSVAGPVGEDYTMPIPASAVNTAIVVTLPAGGSGNVHAACNAQGFQL